MSKKTKRTLQSILALATMAALLAGCSPATTTTPSEAPAQTSAGTDVKSEAPADTGSSGGDAGAYYNEPGTLPVVKEPTTIKVGVPKSIHIIDWKTNAMTKTMEEKTGLNFEFEEFPDGDEYVTKIELLIASGGNELPDVLVRGTPMNVYINWAEAGMIVPLNDYYENLFHWGQETIDQSPDLTKEYIMKYITCYDGNIYGVYNFNNTQNNQYSGSRVNIYRPWLQELNLPIPKTTDEFFDTLKAFVDGDMNKNGKKDEIGLSGEKNTVVNTRKFLMTPFVYTQDNYWTNNGGTIGVSFNTEEWREGLRYVKKLYDNGLLDPAHFTQDGPSLTAVCSSDPQLLGAYTRISTSNMDAGDLDRYNYDRIEQLANSAKPDAKVMTSVQPAIPGCAAFITKNCKTPEAAYMWLDYMTGADMSVMTRYGIEGKEWEYIDTAAAEQQLTEFWQNYPGGNLIEQFYGPGAKPKVGTRFFSATSWGTAQETWWGQVGPNVMTEETQNTFGQKFPETDVEVASYVNEIYARKQLEDAMALRDDSLIIAGLVYNKEEQDVINKKYNEIKLYIEEAWASFAVGTMNIDDDAQWTTYLKTLDDMGLAECIAATQTCVDRMNAQ